MQQNVAENGCKRKSNSETVGAKRPRPSSGQIEQNDQVMEVVPSTSSAVTFVKDRKKAEQINEQIDSSLKRCEDVLLQLIKSLENPNLENIDNPRLGQWKEEAEKLKKGSKLKEIKIAVVGDTGSGKSSLINSVVDQFNLLPTSGMRACTAAIVEITENKENDMYEAEVEFLSREEWFEELRNLIQDTDGTDPEARKDSEEKIKAVYGEKDSFENLSQKERVNAYLDLDKPKFSKCSAEELNEEICKYIEAQHEVAEQYWPIVKRVKLMLPNCNICSSGAVLVDLPGVRDSNATRDKIAREYLKTSDAVWVVSPIHRAIDDKTAKDLLGKNFRRQLILDDSYNNVSFICSKSDDIRMSEISRDIRSRRKDETLYQELDKLDSEIKRQEKLKREEAKTVASLEISKKQLCNKMNELKEALNLPQDAPDNDSGEENEQIELINKIKNYEKDIRETEQKINEAKVKKFQCEEEIHLYVKKKSTICAEFRISKCKDQIKKDFKDGLMEIKLANTTQNNDSDDDSIEREEITRTGENLKVFCISALEYQKFQNEDFMNDGPPKVFDKVESTEILALRDHVHEMTATVGLRNTSMIIERTRNFVRDIKNYLAIDLDKGPLKVESANECISNLWTEWKPVLEEFSKDIKEACDGLSQDSRKGADEARTTAMETQAKWGMKPFRSKRGNGTGLTAPTYKAVVRRLGEYKSQAVGETINLNQELVDPIYEAFTNTWDKVFRQHGYLYAINLKPPQQNAALLTPNESSGLLFNAVSKCGKSLFTKLKKFISEFCEKLNKLGVPLTGSAKDIQHHFLVTAELKLQEMFIVLLMLIRERQHNISNVPVSEVKTSMTPVYIECADMSGKGMLEMIKTEMSNGIQAKLDMFDDAVKKMESELVKIQDEVKDQVTSTCKEICNLLEQYFEPLWEAPTGRIILRKLLLESLEDASRDMDMISSELESVSSG